MQKEKDWVLIATSIGCAAVSLVMLFVVLDLAA